MTVTPYPLTATCRIIRKCEVRRPVLLIPPPSLSINRQVKSAGDTLQSHPRTVSGYKTERIGLSIFAEEMFIRAELVISWLGLWILSRISTTCCDDMCTLYNECCTHNQLSIQDGGGRSVESRSVHRAVQHQHSWVFLVRQTGESDNAQLKFSLNWLEMI